MGIHCAQPFMVQFLKMLVSDFIWQVKGFEPKAGTSGPYSFDLSMAVIKNTSNAAEDMTPQVPGGDTKLASFSLRSSGGQSVGAEGVRSCMANPLLEGQV